MSALPLILAGLASAGAWAFVNHGPLACAATVGALYVLMPYQYSR